MFQNLAKKKNSNDKMESGINLDKMESASFGPHLEDLPAALCSFLPITNDEKHPWKEYLLNEFLSKPILEVFHFSRREI